MEIIGEPWKCMPWQVTKMITDDKQTRIQLKKYQYINGRIDYKKYNVIYCTERDWDTFKREILLSFKQAEKIQI